MFIFIHVLLFQSIIVALLSPTSSCPLHHLISIAILPCELDNRDVLQSAKSFN